ncbi:SAGA-associated factor 11 isoform X1 [Cryptomeria japonica]|uniref:SAGA-associated factor 11 isoform X1 n=1 Tax=Cryptomeria japonica TaxID=3369 RepID=UPI0025AD42E0|nr:SAGA-associated factor 11 isoform X1 [Cryptomeria japonica]XP_057831750.1 SAGA-associated factor 11 isoform X1 [Cryptomeria japonica]
MANEANGKKEMLVFTELLDSVIIDVASECHRAARLGLDPRLNVDEEEEIRVSMEARAMAEDPDNGGKYTVDLFGQSHPAVASDIFNCMNCGRSVVAGRFAPHLEKCTGKGRKARLKVTRSSTSLQQKRARTSPVPLYNTNLNSGGSYNSNRTPNRSSTSNRGEFQKAGAAFK